MSPDSSRKDDRGSISFITSVSLVAALGGLLFGYDTAVINGAIPFMKTHFSLEGAAKGWTLSSALLGCVIGVSFAGYISDRAGRKKTLVMSGILFLVSAVGTALPETLGVFILFRILGGIGVGTASMTSPMYIAEISPARIRGRMVSVYQLAIVTGILVVYFVNYFIALQGADAWNIETGWRWMFASEALPAALFIVLLLFVPESPRWLIEEGHLEKARRILSRVAGSRHADSELGSIQRAIEEETTVSIGQLLKPGIRVVLIIGIALAILQQVTGINVFLYYGTEIFQQLGSDVDASLLETVIVGSVNLVFTVIAIWTVDRIGRRPLMMVGALGMGLSLLAIGLTAQLEAVAVWVLFFILTYIACFAMSVGPVTWVILSEIFPTRIRGRALSIATFCLWTANLVVSQTFPMMDESPWLIEWFHHAFPFYVYGAFCFVLLVVVARLVPETKGRSLEEIESWWGRSR